MFKNPNNNNDTKVGHMRSGREIKEVHLMNLIKKKYRDEGFYNGEEAYLTDKENSKSTRTEEPRQEEP
jgi:hypothetical protein